MMGNGLPLPLALPGTPGCLLLTSPDVALRLPVTAGTTSATLAIPSAGSLLGAALFDQGLAFDPAASVPGMIVSNGVAVRAGVPSLW